MSNKRKGSLPWDVTPSQQAVVADQQDTLKLQHGLFANIPVICKGKDCAYYKVCIVDKGDITPGERCPVEIAMILNRFEEYCKALGITDKDTVDMSLVRELVDIEIQLFRADALMAIDVTPVEQVLAAIAEDGTPYYKPELSRAVDYKAQLRKSRHSILTLLNSTRKDREAGKIVDPSTQAALLMQKVEQLTRDGKLKGINPAGDDK